MIEIESGIPYPGGYGGSSPKYPFEKMKPGDSFLVGDKSEGAKRAGYIFASRQHPKWKFSFRKTDAGYRCWRVE